MLPSMLPRLATDSAGRVFPGVWKHLFLRFPSQDGAPSPPPLSLFPSFIFFPTCFWRQWSAFLVAWCPLPTFRSCFVEFAQCWNVLLMNLWGRKWSPRPIPPPSSICLQMKHLRQTRFVLPLLLLLDFSKYIKINMHKKSIFVIYWVNKVTQLCLTLCDPMEGSRSGSSVHGILQARILEWVAISFSRRSSQPRMETRSPALQADSLPIEPLRNKYILYREHSGISIWKPNWEIPLFT